MKHRHTPPPRREIGLVPYLVPLGWTLAAVLAFIVLVTWPELFSQPLPPDAGSAAEALSLLPSLGGDLSVPDAGRVFKEQPAQAVEHARAF